MASLNPVEARVEVETRVLRFLCDENGETEARDRVQRLLESYRWGDPNNAIFFECICELFARDPRQILARLPAAVTRRGFPDMPCETLEAAEELNSAGALELAESLLHPSTSDK